MANLATINTNILADSGIDDINVIVSTGSYANPAWITSLAWTKITGVPSFQLTSEKGQPNGYASLDSNGKVPLVQINDALIGNVNFQGLWNASTNTPTLANPPAAGTKGYYYIVSTAGTFAGITFEVGDWIISNGSAWGKVDNTDAVSSVFGRTGNVVAANGDYTTAQVTESGNLYYTDARSRAALSFSAGSGAYNTSTGVITIPTDNNQIANSAGYITSAALSGYVPTSRTITINGTTQDLSANRTFNVGTVTSVTASSPIFSSGGSTPNITIQQSGPSASGFLSNTDWNTFNNKQNTISLTTTGTSGVATLIGTTLNIPNYGGALSGYLPLTGGTLTGPLGGTSASFSGDVTANRYRGVNSLVLNSYTTVNPSSNVFLYSQPNDRDAWIFLDSADTGSNWGIYHRQIDSAVAGLPGNSIGFIGGGSSILQGWISLLNGQAAFNNNIAATSSGVDGTFADAFIGRYSANNNETNAIQTSVSSIASGSGFRFQASNGGGSSARTTVADLLRDRQIFYGNVGIATTTPVNRLHLDAGKFIITSNDGGYGQFQINAPAGGEATLLLGSGGSGQNSGGYANVGVIGMGAYGNSASLLVLGTGYSGGTMYLTGGNVLIGTNISNGNRLRVNGITWVDGMIFSVQSNGTVRTSNADAAGMLHIRPNAGQNGYINFTENAVDDRWSIGITAGDSNFYFRRPYPTSPAVASISASGAATFNGSVTASGGFEIPNGQFYRARRISGDLLTDMIGIPSGTNDVRVLTTGDFNIINGSLTNLMTVKNGGNVGIGTTSTPATRLEVTLGSDSSAEIQRWSYGLGNIGYSLRLRQDVSSGLVKHVFDVVNNSTTYSNNLVLTNGTVGIGTSSPNRLLTVSGTTSGLIALNATSFRNTTIGSDIVGNFIVYDDTAATYRMVINSSGNFLIGTTTDNGNRLRVNGNAFFDNNVGVYGQLYYTSFYSAGNPVDFIRITYGGGSACGIKLTAYNPNNGLNSDLGFQVMTSDGVYTQPLYLQGANNRVGIGTNNPTYRLQIGNSGSLADSIRIGDYQVSPNTRQYIGYARFDSGLFESSGNGDTPSTVLAGVAGIRIVNTAGIIAPSQADNSVQILTHIYNGNSRVALHASFNGNIGIGTTSPNGARLVISDTASNKLTISGGTTQNGMTWEGTGGANAFYLFNGTIDTAGWGIYNINTAAFPLFVTNGSNVLVGTTIDNGRRLRVNGRSYFDSNIAITPTSESWAEGLSFIMPTTSTWGGLRWRRERGGNDGNWYIGYTALDSTDDLVFGANNGGAQVDNVLRLTKSGAISAVGSITAAAFFESSDSKIKTLLDDKLDYQAIANVTAKYYEKNGKVELGYFAQDFEELLPSAVSKNEDGLLNLSYREVHTAKIAYLEEEIRQLKKKYENN